MAISNPYNLGIKHIYTGKVGDLFIAKLYVKNADGDMDEDQYRVKIYQSSDLSNPEELDVRVNMSIDEGLWNLHKTMIRGIYPAAAPGYGQIYGYWVDTIYGFDLAAVGACVDAFQMNGHKINLDYDNNPYVETVQRALHYIIYNTYAHSIGPQPYGNPDTNNNGIGLVSNHTSELNDSRQTYIGGICLVALASCGASNTHVALGRNNVYGRSYAEIVQDMVDFFAWGQVDSGSGRGGWRYYANYGNSDMSTTQWPPLGMFAAEKEMGSEKIHVPQFVRDELVHFLVQTQNMDMDSDNGGFGYGDRWTYLNITKTAAGLICYEFCYLTPGQEEEYERKLAAFFADINVQRAIGYIYRHWNDSGAGWDNTQLHGNSYGMYGAMKAFRLTTPDIMKITEFDYTATPPGQTDKNFNWYYTPSGQTQQGLASYVVAAQQSDGSWDDIIGPNLVRDAFSTGWHILTISPDPTTRQPVAVICDCEKQEYNFNQDIYLNGTCSYHTDRNRAIIKYEWDVNDDGIVDEEGKELTIVGGFNVEGYYPITLIVTDDNPYGAQTDAHTCNVYVHPPPHCPHAFICDPEKDGINGWVNQALTLDASCSWDPDNEIVSWEWDLDNDGLYGNEDSDCFGKDSDGIGETIEWIWSEPYTNVIGIRITDAAGEFEACSDYDKKPIDIGNHAPISDPGGPYKAPRDSCITVKGTGSYDLDPDDTITYAWDLDNDGDFDDCSEAQCEFCVGSNIGQVYDICLKVTDSFSEYDIECTTIKIIANQSPVAKCKDVTMIADDNCQAVVLPEDVDNGSEDPDGDQLILSLDPQGPYPIGTTNVTLLVSDGTEIDTCEATITVLAATDLTYEGEKIVSTEGNPTADVNLIAMLRNEDGSIFETEAEIVTFTLTAEGVETIAVSAETSGGIAQLVQTLEPAIYNIKITLACSNATTSAILVIFNPKGGFVSGGGWIVPEDNGLNTHVNEGANFGFNAMYKKGDSTGHLEFRYSDGYIDLKSYSVDQLVITGGKIAHFKGEAFLNGKPGYHFHVKAIDNAEPGSNDIFDINIWAPEDDIEGDPSERAGGILKGGNISIHVY